MPTDGTNPQDVGRSGGAPAVPLRLLWFGEAAVLAFGKVLLTGLQTILKEVGGVVKDAFRGWSVEFSTRHFVRILVSLNPSLSQHQQERLLVISHRALDQLFWQQGNVDSRVIRGIIAIACPNEDTASLFNSLVDTIAGLRRIEPPEATTSTNGHSTDASSSGSFEPSAPPLDPRRERELFAEPASSSQDAPYTEDHCVLQILRKAGIQDSRLRSMSPAVRMAVLEALTGDAAAAVADHLLMVKTGDTGARPSAPPPPPMCSITLEPLLTIEGTISPDVLAIVQWQEGTRRAHAYLYRGSALQSWMSASARPTNPETRSQIRPEDLYRLS
eukprot:TRINITY_DN16203_c0_g1_i1.p1 TRINITY_DN16203_c0_g1~~TRINITY_DN16203_c0_g1_i1.p1  ORF type:complete len:330 (-),score=23.15 TRINITY_DN16203_c0_g1_i1:298-1287(-)